MGKKSGVAGAKTTTVVELPEVINEERKGPVRPFRVTSPPASQSKDRSFGATDRICLSIVTIFAIAVRFFRLSQPSSVVFDEVHFGGFARKYIIGRFFMDVHPPLAKMLYAVVGWLAGYDGEFEFQEIGLDYIEPGVPYVAMRMLPATLGVLTIMLAYATLRSSGCRPTTAMFGAGLMTIDNALATQSRYILLDAPLVFFIAITAYGFRKFQNEVPFTRDWVRYLFLTGLGLGATVSSKWVGLFTIAWVGLSTIYQLWWIWGDLTVSLPKFFKHFLTRVFCLIFVPVAFYMGMFYLHFICVVNYGDGASFMSPEFQSTLQHNKMISNVPADIAYGSEIAIRHVNTRGGFLHSHEHMYETGSQQQQITLYPHRDENNVWIIEKAPTQPPGEDDEPWAPLNYSEEPLEFVQDGDIVRLRHKVTQRRLHSHDHRPPVSEQDHQNEVSCYGFEGFAGDSNDNFRVEIIAKKSEPGLARERVRTLETKFRLVHMMSGCAVFSHDIKLPKWAFEQQEVTCMKQAAQPNTLWYIEENFHPKLGADAELISYRKPGFLEKFFELNQVMWTVNKGLTDSHAWESRPDSWPFLKRGINFWVKDHTQVYLLGNAVVWWSITAVIVLYCVFKGLWIIRWQRGFQDFHGDVAYSVYDSGFGNFLLAWALHYFPSFLMDRQLFLHHYLGSLYFGILAFTQFWEFVNFRLIKNKMVGNILTLSFFSAALAFFYQYSPLMYGGEWTKELCNTHKFLDMDFDCNAFFDKYEDYRVYASELAAKPSSVPVPDTFQEPEDDSILDDDEEEYYAVEHEGEQIAEPEEDPVPEPTEDDEDDEAASAVPTRPPHVTESADITKEISKSLEEAYRKHQADPKVYEYRDEEGNIIPPDRVLQMQAEGKLKLRTERTEKSIYYDENGHYVSEGDEVVVEDAAADETEPNSGGVTSDVPPAHTRLSSEQKVEYKDAEGNVLPEEVVRSLEAEGKIKVNTVKTFKSRLLDSDGNLVQEDVVVERDE